MDTTPRHSFYKRMVFLGLIAANLFGAFFALTMSRFPSQSSPRPVTAVDAPGTIRLNSSSTLTPALTSSYTTASHSVSGVSSTSFQMSYAKTSSGAFSAHSLADQGFVANLSALSNITHIVVSAKLSASYSTISTYPPNLLVMVSDTYFSDPMSYYSALSSRTLSTSYQSFDYDVSSYGMKLGSQTLAVTYQGFSASKEVDVSNVGASTRTLDSGALTSQDTYLYNTANLPNDASLSGRTLTFSSASNSYTGAWDIAATPRSSSEFNKFKGGYWQLGSSTASYTSLTLTSRYLYEDVTAFQVQAKKNNGGSVVVSSSIDGTSLFSSTLTTSYQTLSANLSSSPKSGRISLTFTATSGFFYFGHLSITTSGGIKAYYTPSEQANATRNFIQQFKTCPSGISDAAVIRAAKEYNAMNLDTVSGTNGKAIFKTLSETVNDYDYSDASQYSNGSYIGGSASLSGVNIYDKLSTMPVIWCTRRPNRSHFCQGFLWIERPSVRVRFHLPLPF